MQESRVVETVNNGGVFTLTPADFAGRRMTTSEAVAIFGSFGAFWEYPGEPRADRPHALLKSGLHSNGFINCRAVLDFPRLCMLFAEEMLKTVEESIVITDLLPLGFVASSAYSALDLGFCLTWLLSQKYNTQIKRVMAEKDASGNPTVIRGGIDSTLSGLVINELMTTAAGSTWETKEAVLKSNGDKPAPLVLSSSFVLMHRSRDLKLPDDSPVVPVFHFNIDNFAKDNCPYCQAGSEAIKPKVGDNWQRLHGLI